MIWGLQRAMPRPEQVEWVRSQGGRMGATPLQACFLFPGTAFAAFISWPLLRLWEMWACSGNRAGPWTDPGGEQPLQG